MHNMNINHYWSKITKNYSVNINFPPISEQIAKYNSCQYFILYGIYECDWYAYIEAEAHVSRRRPVVAVLST